LRAGAALEGPQALAACCYGAWQTTPGTPAHVYAHGASPARQLDFEITCIGHALSGPVKDENNGLLDGMDHNHRRQVGAQQLPAADQQGACLPVGKPARQAQALGLLLLLWLLRLLRLLLLVPLRQLLLLIRVVFACAWGYRRRLQMGRPSGSARMQGAVSTHGA
jgi:hypothetical protein